MPKTIPLKELERFKRFPGFISLNTDGDTFVCAIKIKGQRRRMGAYTLDMLYDSVRELINKSEKKK